MGLIFQNPNGNAQKTYILLRLSAHLPHQFGAASALPERKSDRYAAGCRCHTRICIPWGTGAGLISPDRGINISESQKECPKIVNFIVMFYAFAE